MKDLYLISYRAGSCGTFISSLIYSWLENISLPLTFSEYGDAHDCEIYKENWNITGSEIYSSPQLLKLIKPITLLKPFVVLQHAPPDINFLKENFKNYLHIRITITGRDLELLSAFTFFKLYLKEYNLHNSIRWDRIKGLCKNPNNLNKSNLKYYIDLIANIKNNKDHYWNEKNFHNTLTTKNEFMLKFNDIIFNKNKVLNYLSEILEKPTTSIVEQTYDNYIMVNKNIINSKCPWINF